jgi:N-acetylneuraminic acid mutarotase
MKSAHSLPPAHRSNPRNAFHLIARFLTHARHSGTTAICLALTLGLSNLAAEAQTRQWAWMGGSNTQNQPGVYGTLGTPAPGNIPGARSNASTWTDSSGNLWLFGGKGYDKAGQYGLLNDIWELNPLTRQWTWMSGSSTLACVTISGAKQCGQTGVYGTLGTPAAGNTPGGRASAASWTDAAGNLWLFGGSGFSSVIVPADFNDLWEFSPSSGEWTWMGGSNTPSQHGVYGTLGTPAVGNIPGSRESTATWTDSGGNFWLFGGYGFDSAGNQSPLNDLWKFTPATSQWTWMSGTSTLSCTTQPPGGCVAPSAVYGTLGVPAAGNTPGGRYLTSGWTDSNGNLWLFGGAENGSGLGGGTVDLNDLWEFNPSTQQWAWIGGSNTPSQSGVYGTLGVPSTGNIPGSRSSAFTWTDHTGNLWLLGGFNTPGFNSTQSTNFNDLWQLNPTSLQWTWMGGSGTLNCSNNNFGCGQAATYGTLGFPAAGNDPGGRYSVAAWQNAAGNLWLFGGLANLSTGATPYLLNDLWELGVAASSPSFSPAAGTYTGTQTLTITDASPGAIIYYTTDGSTPSTSSNIYTSPITLTHTTTVTAFASATGLMNSPLTTAKYTLQAAPTVTLTPSASSITTAQPLSVVVAVSGGNGTATGSVVVSSGTYASSASALTNGSATINIAAGSLAAGTDTLTATYTPDSASSPVYTSATGTATVVVTVPVPVTFTLSNSGNITINRGAATGNTGTSTISATPSGGFTGAVNLSCAISSSPANVVDAPTCSLSPTSLTITGTAVVTSTLTIATTASTGKLDHPFALPSILAPAGGVAFACICFFGLPRRRVRAGLLVVLLAAAASIGMSGCSSSGSSSKSGGTTVGNYTVTVTAVSGSITQSAFVSLTVSN